MAVHNPAECFSLKANKANRPAGWGVKRRECQKLGSQHNSTALTWISKNKSHRLLLQTPLQNYWTPLASQVEELDETPPQLNLFLLIQQHPPCYVTFALSPFHIDKDSIRWKQSCSPNKRATYCISPLTALNHMRTDVLNSTIPSAVSNTGATSSTFLK